MQIVIIVCFLTNLYTSFSPIILSSPMTNDFPLYSFLHTPYSFQPITDYCSPITDYQSLAAGNFLLLQFFFNCSNNFRTGRLSFILESGNNLPVPGNKEFFEIPFYISLFGIIIIY